MTDMEVTGRGRLILFGRYPVPGQTKTRLIPTLGVLGSAELQRRLTLRSLRTMLQPHLPPTTFCYTGGTLDQMRRWLDDHGVEFQTQRGKDLGARMRTALFEALDRGEGPAVLVGTDIARFRSHHLTTALNALGQHDVVLGPSRDGGYWLVGLRRPVDIFSNIQWDAADVLDQTLSAILRQGLSVTQVAALDDIDTENDLRRWIPEQEWPRPYLSVIIPTLNEAAAIRPTVDRVRAYDCEIIVADGGSSDRTVDHARAAGAVAITTGRGRALQQNQAAKMATGQVLLFLHADTRLPWDYGHHIFETLMAPSVAAGAFQFKTDFDHWQMRWLERGVRLRASRFQMPYGDQGLFMTKATFEIADGFDDVPIAEDLYLVRRLKKMGRIATAPAEAVTSARRWKALGIWRTTWVNLAIAAGCRMGVDPVRMAPIYRWGIKTENQKSNQPTDANEKKDSNT